MIRKAEGYTVFCLDVDGVMTDGTFFYSRMGKVLKRFGPEDGDALKALRPFIEIRFLTADMRGLKISRARIVRDLGFPLDLVPAERRERWISSRYRLQDVIYMGDSFLDAPLLRAVGLSFAPANGHYLAMEAADYTTTSRGGSGAVAEACFRVATLLGLDVPSFKP